MKKAWNQTLQQMIWIALCGLGAGLIFGYAAWGLACALLIYLGFFLYQFKRLEEWLANYPQATPPETTGLWGIIFDRLYRLQKEGLLSNNTVSELLDKAQAAASPLSDGVLSVDPHGNLQWWNPAAARLLKLQFPDDQGRNITQLIREPAFVVYFQRGNYTQPYELAPLKQEARILQIHVTLFGDQRLLLVRDISNLHHLQQVRSDFIANVSHELRTPLTVLKGYLEIFQDVPELNRYQQGLTSMLTQAQRMQDLIDDLLLLSRLEHHHTELKIEPVSIPSLLRGLQEETVMLRQPKQMTIELDIEHAFSVKGNYSDLHSALLNLISNAIKYSPECRSIQLIAGINTKGEAFVTIADQGIGIDPALIPRLTERFFRVDTSRNSDTGGTGLGLAIVKHVLLRHNSRLEISSQPGIGSRFSCIFPSDRVVL